MPAFLLVVKGIYSNRKQYTRRVLESFKILLHNLPKVLFLFMPFSPLIFGFPQQNDGITLIMAFLHFTIFVPIIDFLTALSY
jgi:hypothetical protein